MQAEKEYRGSIKWYLKAIELNPLFYQAYTELGITQAYLEEV